MIDIDAIKTAVDVGLGAIALLYAHRVGRLLEKQDVRITKLERRRVTGKR